MKPFNLEAALAGEAVITRSGFPVTGLHLFDITTDYPLYGIVEGRITSFTKDGIYNLEVLEHHSNLHMAPRIVKIWRRTYRTTTSGIYGTITTSTTKNDQPYIGAAHKCDWVTDWEWIKIEE